MSSMVRRGRGLAAVDEPEPSGLRLDVALATAAHHEPHRRADAAGPEKAEPERARGDERQLRAQLAGDVRGPADRAAQVADRIRQCSALRPQLLAQLRVGLTGHSSAPRSSASLPRSPAPAPAAFPSTPS